MTKTLGILGGGQLGLMSARAAKALKIKTIIYTPEQDSPASSVADSTIVAPYDDEAALHDFAAQCDVISYEFENIPVATVEILQKFKPVYPDHHLLNVTQDRLKEKAFLNESGIPTARWAEATSPADITRTLNEWGVTACVLKTTRFGYDGKGQARIKKMDDIDSAWNDLGADILIIEELIDFDCEISVIVARDADGNAITYPPALNEHRDGILHTSTAPSGLDSDVLARAEKKAVTLANAVNLQGVLALELFVTKDGTLLANEIAPRTHNSGHWAIEACETSQFTNHVRTVCGMPALPANQHTACEMINLIGDDMNDLAQYGNQDNVYIHDYGKTEVKAGRKMGHVTILKDWI